MATSCSKCGKLLPTLPGVPTPETCRDQAACDRRAAALPPRPAAPEGPCEQPPPSQEEVVKAVSEGQRGLAVRALTLTHTILAKMEDQVQNGVEVVLKDGTTKIQEVPPMALATMLRELRPVVQEPVRVKEAADGIGAPLQLDTRNPAVVAAVIKALTEHREAKKRAANALLEGEVVSEVPAQAVLAQENTRVSESRSAEADNDEPVR